MKTQKANTTEKVGKRKPKKAKTTYQKFENEDHMYEFLHVQLPPLPLPKVGKRRPRKLRTLPKVGKRRPRNLRPLKKLENEDPYQSWKAKTQKAETHFIKNRAYLYAGLYVFR